MQENWNTHVNEWQSIQQQACTSDPKINTVLKTQENVLVYLFLCKGEVERRRTRHRQRSQ